MPYETTLFQLPCGAQACRLEVSGELALEETREILQTLVSGGRLFGMPLLILSQKLDSITSDARAAIAEAGRHQAERWEAAVVTSTVIRVIVNFIMRIQGRKKTKLFTTEAEALQWLDARVREEREAGPGTP
jgi:hypothetical protein